MGVMTLPASSRNMCSNMFFVFGFLISACSAKSPLPDISPLYPFNGGNSFKPTPFAPANDQAWIDNNLLNQYNYLLNSQAPLKVDPYANYWAFKNSLRKRRSVDGEEEDEDD